MTLWFSAGKPLTAPASAAVALARQRPLVTNVRGVPAAARPTVHAALVDASVHAFRVGVLISAILVYVGGLAALIGIENPKRTVRCADCPGGALAGASADVAHADVPARPLRTPVPVGSRN